jgi:hypothetical protein
MIDTNKHSLGFKRFNWSAIVPPAFTAQDAARRREAFLLADTLSRLYHRLEDAELLLQRTNVEDALRIADSLSKKLTELERSNGVVADAQHAATAESVDDPGVTSDRTVAAANVLATIRQRHRQMVRRLKERRRGDLETEVGRYWRRLLARGAIAVAAIAILVGTIYGVRFALAPIISIVEASYGINCHGTTAGIGTRREVLDGNATAAARGMCEGSRRDCVLVVEAHVFGDPAPFCAKEFRISWRCSNRPDLTQTRIIPAEAQNKSLRLDCPA